jgi:hypothetical protein
MAGSWHKTDTYADLGILVERRWAKQSEWVEIVPTANQRNHVILYAKRTMQNRYTLRFICSLYVNKKLELEYKGKRQAIEFDTWLQMCVDFARITRQPYSELLYNLRYLRDHEPTWEKGLLVPDYEENDE